MIGSAWAELILIFSPNPPGHPPTHPGTNLSELIKDLLSWLYPSFHWSECGKKFREDPNKVPDHIKIKIRMSNPSQEPPASSKTPNQDMKDMDVLCTFKIKIESQNSDQGCVKDPWPYWNQDQDAKSQSETSGILQNPKWGLKGHGCSLHLQNPDRKPKFLSS